jgi:hypothetical protein
MTQNLTIAKMVSSFWLLSNRFIKCPVISQNDILENVMVLNRDIELNVTV